jgi:mannosyl-oligosaccharide alpha-1,2-mannosidase
LATSDAPNKTAHDLITGPLSDNVSKTANVTAILTQAKRLADNLKVAFNTTSGVPDNNLYFNPPRRGGSDTNGIATIGTLVLEWTRLSDLTGDPQYGALAQKGESYLLSPSPALGQPFPGLLGTNVRLSDGQFVDGNGGWGGGDDSFYEYLIKMYLYDPQRFAKYRDRWVAAADSSIKYLASHPTTRPDLTYLAMWQNTTLRFTSQHRRRAHFPHKVPPNALFSLVPNRYHPSFHTYPHYQCPIPAFPVACFNGGNFILGGLTLDEPRYTRFGLALVDGCHDTYTSTATGIGPEIFSWQDASLVPLNAPNNPGPPAAQAAFYNASGFWIDNGAYVLRPEVLESYYYAYRATGDPKYQDWAWAAFQAINATCRVGSGYSDIKDVNKPGGGGFDDFQESFWFAEVLKYSYLIHAEVSAACLLLDGGET